MHANTLAHFGRATAVSALVHCWLKSTFRLRGSVGAQRSDGIDCLLRSFDIVFFFVVPISPIFLPRLSSSIIPRPQFCIPILHLRIP
jgi:hypothetical protein